ETQSLEDSGPREIHIDIVFENDVDHREAEGGRGAHRLYPGQALQIDGEGIRDLVLHFLWTSPGPVREYDDLILTQVGNGIDVRLQQGPIAPAREKRVCDQHQETVS